MTYHDWMRCHDCMRCHDQMRYNELMTRHATRYPRAHPASDSYPKPHPASDPASNPLSETSSRIRPLIRHLPFEPHQFEQHPVEPYHFEPNPLDVMPAASFVYMVWPVIFFPIVSLSFFSPFLVSQSSSKSNDFFKIRLISKKYVCLQWCVPCPPPCPHGHQV